MIWCDIRFWDYIRLYNLVSYQIISNPVAAEGLTSIAGMAIVVGLLDGRQLQRVSAAAASVFLSLVVLAHLDATSLSLYMASAMRGWGGGGWCTVPCYWHLRPLAWCRWQHRSECGLLAASKVRQWSLRWFAKIISEIITHYLSTFFKGVTQMREIPGTCTWAP